MGMEREESPVSRPGFVLQRIILLNLAGVVCFPLFVCRFKDPQTGCSFVRSWALDLKGRGIRVNVVSPGPVRTPGLGGRVPDEHRQGLFDAPAAQVPLGRLGEPGEIGKVVAFLASDAASFINGTALFVDGGMAQV